MLHRTATLQWPAKALIALVFGGIACSSSAWAAGEPSFKIGLNRLSMTGAIYTHEDVATGDDESNSDAMAGADLFFEWVASDHFGIEIGSTITPLTRAYQLGPDSGIISENVKESASYTTLGANLYFSRATRKGFQYLLGVATGTIAVKHDFEQGAGSLADTTSSNSIPVNIIKFGIDWVTDLAGLRFQYQSLTAATSNTTEITGVKQTLTYSGSVIALGVFAFF